MRRARPPLSQTTYLSLQRSAGSRLNARVHFYGIRSAGKARCNEFHEYEGIDEICKSASVRGRPMIGRGVSENRPITRRLAVAT